MAGQFASESVVNLLRNTQIIMKKSAIMLDAGYLKPQLGKALRSFPTARNVIDFTNKCIQPDEELFRVYYYDCPPYEGQSINPISRAQIDFSKTRACNREKSLQDALAIQDHIAFRKGSLMLKGWVIDENSTRAIIANPRPINDTDLKPDIKQKLVDMKIGLDVAWLSSKRIVDKIILVTGDSDFIPAMKFARREGVQIVLVRVNGKSVKRELLVHSDETRDVKFP